MEDCRKDDELIEGLLGRLDIDEVVDKILEKRKAEAKELAPPEAWFLGPKAEHGDIWLTTFDHIFRDYVHWRRNYFPGDPMIVDRERLRSHEPWIETLKFEIDSVLNQLKAHFPFYSPRYIAHMISEQTFPGVVGYFAGMLYNPNNVTEESAPITTSLEIEVGQMIAEMLGYDPEKAWAHICSGGTLANLEALWIARTVQFVPLMIHDYCEANSVSEFEIELPDGSGAKITDLSLEELVAVTPSVAIGMERALSAHMSEQLGPGAGAHISEFFSGSRFNIANAGVHRVLNELGLTPAVFASEAAHYSVKKAMNILGYGENALELIPVESHFRMNVAKLEERLTERKPGTYVAAVIGVAGTTEEGAVDPLHKIRDLRARLEKSHNRSFWFHVDAAWGGYVRSIFRGHGLASTVDPEGTEAACEIYREAIKIREETSVRKLDLVDGRIVESEIPMVLEWADEDVCSAFLAMPSADSITIDPHKLGYLPYPAGVIAFRDKRVTELVVQRAQYITDEMGGVKDAGSEVEINAVGPYIIEGSKPGAVAAACWLSHKTIPLTYKGHGRLIKTSLLNTLKLARYFELHSELFDSIELQLEGKLPEGNHRFTFELLSEPDTNLICFLCVPVVEREDGSIVRDNGFSLGKINRLNRDIYRRATITNTPSKRNTPYSQEFFVSRTTLSHEQYRSDSIGGLLDRLRVTPEEYEKEGIFLLRSVVMNPWHYLAEKQGKNYLYDFVLNLHQIARHVLDS